MTQQQEKGPNDPGMRKPGEFETAYQTAVPKWDIGHPQAAYVALAESGAISGKVLDVGCGTGEHVLMLAARGLDVTGVDTAESAISHADEKARDRGLTARFFVHDATRLAGLAEHFDTVLDCGLFHVLDDVSRVAFADSVHSVLRPGGHYFMLCFSDQQPVHIGPRRVSQKEIKETFSGGWRVNSIVPSRIENKAVGGLAWLADITRL
jgi:cyclopropane fatty-acyl-phospholipid synthase-like methyltransferase